MLICCSRNISDYYQWWKQHNIFVETVIWGFTDEQKVQKSSIYVNLKRGNQAEAALFVCVCRRWRRSRALWAGISTPVCVRSVCAGRRSWLDSGRRTRAWRRCCAVKRRISTAPKPPWTASERSETACADAWVTLASKHALNLETLPQTDESSLRFRRFKHHPFSIH